MRGIQKKILVYFIIGYVLLVGGLFWFADSTVANYGIYSLHIGGFYFMKLILILPFLLGVLWAFINYEAKEAKLIMVVGALMIIMQEIISIRYRFAPISRGQYAGMMLLIFGGLILVIRAIYLRNKDKNMFEKK